MNDRPILSKEQLNHFSGKVLECAFKVHSILGPGLLERAYETCLMHELNRSGIFVKSQVVLPLHYDGVEIDLGYRVDLIIQDSILVELKSVEKISAQHEAQLLTYLRLSQYRLGLLINFNVLRLKDGIKRLVNRF